MIRLIALLAAGTALAGCAAHATCAGSPLAAAEPKRRRRRPPPAASPRSAASASTRPAWTRTRHAGRQFLPIRQRHLGQEHADPGRQVQLRHVHRARRSVASERTRDLLEDGQGRSQQQDRRRLRELPRRGGGRGQGPGADSSRGSTKFAGSTTASRLCRLVRQGRRATASARLFGGGVGQDDTQQRGLYRWTVTGRPRHARPRLLSAQRAKLVERAAPISTI